MTTWYEKKREWVLRSSKTKRIRTGKQPAIRLCARCGYQATSSRHVLCDACRARTRPESQRTGRSQPRVQLPRQQRGYGHTAAHDALRKRWVPRVEGGGVTCARCGRLIEPGTLWDLGHPFDDKKQTSAPWHRRCNRPYASSITRPRRQAERRSQ